MTWTVGDQLGQSRAMLCNHLQSLKFQVSIDGMTPEEFETNCQDMVKQMKTIALLKTYKPDKTYKRSMLSDS